jgi:hypothetical protein
MPADSGQNVSIPRDHKVAASKFYRDCEKVVSNWLRINASRGDGSKFAYEMIQGV